MSETIQATSNEPLPVWQKSAVPKGQSGLRALNERRILTLIRQHQQLPKAQIAKQTGLSAQAATVIINRLEHDGLLQRGEPHRGKRGQPSVPFSLRANGAFGLGIKIGRRSMQISLIDFLGNVRASLCEHWDFPAIEAMQRFTQKGLRAILSALDEEEVSRVSGVGVAMPFEIWRWGEQAGAPEDELARWKEFDVLAAVQEFTELPVYLCNDDIAACAAELWFGQHRELSDYLYCFVGTFIGGGMVLNRKLHVGRSGNAGAVGSLPVLAGSGNAQLLDSASLHRLEKTLKQTGVDTAFLHGRHPIWPENLPEVADWLEVAAEGIVQAAISAHAFLDLDAVVIEGAVPDTVKQALLHKCEQLLAKADCRGLSPLRLLPGSVGADARALGCANLPLLAQYSL